MRTVTKFALFVLAFSTIGLGQDKVALATKVSGQVTLTRATAAGIPLKRNTIINTSDKILTGSDGVAVLMFIDDRSILRIQRNSNLEIGGQRNATGIDKQVNMQYGKLKAEVAEQRQGQFLISTPTSVASVKGTDFWATSDPILGDIFLGLSGLIEIQNLISNEIIQVGGGQVGTSSPSGETNVSVYVLLVGDLLSVSSNLLTMEASEIGEGGESFNGNIVLGPTTTYAGPTATVGAQATVSGTLNDDGAVAAIQIEIQEADDEFEQGDTQGTGGDPTQGTREIRIQLEDANGDLKEVIIIIQ